MKIAALCLLFMLFVTSPGPAAQIRGAQIRGVVRSTQGILLKGIPLYLLSAEKARRTETDENGKFEFLDLPINTYDLEVRQVGFVPMPAQEISFSEPAVREITVVLQLTASDCLPKIRATYESRTDLNINLVGKIAEYSDSAGPVKNATLTATQTGTTQGTIHRTYVANSDEKGEFQFVGMEPGKYTLEVSHREYLDFTGIDFWVTHENLTRLPTVYVFQKNKHFVIVCQ